LIPGPDFLISDAVTGGNEHFYWLPPMADDPGSFTTAFDGSLSPVVRICDLADCAANQVAEFTTTTGPGSETVRVMGEDQHYIVNWHTDESNVSPGPIYRITVLAGGTPLGFADVQFRASGQDAKNLSTDQIIGLLDGRTLPIKFRIEEGAVFVISPTDGGTVEALDGTVTIEIPPGALAEETGITVEPVDEANPPEPLPDDGDALPGTVVDFGPDGLEFEEPVELALPIPATLPVGVILEALRLYRAGPDGWELMPGDVDLANGVVTGLTTHFSSFAILPGGVTNCDGSGFAELDSALAAVGPGGTVTVCDGTHTVQNVPVLKPVTIEGEAGFRPTLTLAGAAWGIVLDPGPGTATIRNLRFDANYTNNSRAIRVNENHDQVVIDDVQLDVGGDGRSGVFVFQSINAGARTVISNSTITGGSEGVFVFNGSGAQAGSSAVDVLNSTITGQNWNAIQYNRGASGLIQGNTLSSCGPRACIRVTGPDDPTRIQVEPMRVIGNAISATTNETQVGIVLDASYGQTFEIRDNVISGDPVTGDPSLPESYSFHGNGIRVENPTATGDITGNSISSAYHGITTDGGTTPLTALDNFVDAVWAGVRVVNGGQMSIQSSDLTDYLVPISTDGLFGSGDLTCNWWGDIGGPLGVDAGIAADVYRPWALTSIAGTSASECAMEVRVAAVDNGSGLPYVGTLAEAASVIASGGRIYVSDGTHSAEGIVVDRPMTIEAEAGAGPVIQTNVASAAFFLDGYDVGTVVIDGLDFDITTTSPGADGKTTYAIRGSGTYAGLMVRNSNFTVGPFARGGIAVLTSTVPPTVQVENTSIDGGVFAIAANGVQLDVTNSQFTGGRGLRIQYAASTGRVEGSIFSDCGTFWCVRVLNSSDVEIVDNTFAGPTLTGDPGPDLDEIVYAFGGSTALISGNDFQGCAYWNCVHVQSSTATITGNTFTHIGGQAGLEFEFVSNVLARFGANVTVENNLHTACGYACYKILDGATAVIRQETMSVSPGHGTGPVLLGGRDDAASANNVITFEDNVVTGSGAVEPTDPASYPAEEGIALRWSDAIANRNAFTLVARGASVGTDATLTGGDNVFDQTFTAANIYDNGFANFRSNDFTNYVNPIDGGNGSDLTCNWWGDAGGPVGVDAGIAADVYTPWATVSVAGTSTTTCSGGL
jgi:hypothetical protein